MEVKNKVFIITGAASGLGKACAQLLLKKGAKVACFDKQMSQESSKEDDTDSSLNLNNQMKINVDITHESDVENAINSVMSKFGALHGLINCAGIAKAGKVLGKNGIMPLASFKEVIDVNLIGTFNMIRLCVPFLSDDNKGMNDAHEENGVIINTASIAAFEGQIGQSAYAASKSAIVGLTLPLARELASLKIRVMTIAPGLMSTPMLEGMDDKIKEALISQTIFPKRLGKAQEFSMLVEQIIENPLLNGSTIRLDGAIRLSAK